MGVATASATLLTTVASGGRGAIIAAITSIMMMATTTIAAAILWVAWLDSVVIVAKCDGGHHPGRVETEGGEHCGQHPEDGLEGDRS